MVVIAIAMVVGACGPTASPQRSTSLIPSPSGPLASASFAADGSASPSLSWTSAALATWTQVDLPNPTLLPGSFGARVKGVVAFQGGYVAVGSEDHITPGQPDWAGVVSLVWTSTDGRSWTVDGAGFGHADLEGVATDGERLVAYGFYTAPRSGTSGVPVGAAWVSTDGVHWTRAADPAPVVVVVTPHGFVGALVHPYLDRNGFCADAESVQFATSSDGLHWTTTSRVFSTYLGWWQSCDGFSGAIASAADGSVVAVGLSGTDWTSASSVFWRSVDGRTWPAPTNAGGQLLNVEAVAAAGSDFLVVAGNTLWRISPRLAPAAVTVQVESTEQIDQVLAAGNLVLVAGATLVDWWSTDGGRTFQRQERPDAFVSLVPGRRVAALIATPTGLLAAGSLYDGSGNRPEAWLASR